MALPESIESLALAEMMGEILHNRHPSVVGAALAVVLAKWLAGHQARTKDGTFLPDATDKMQRNLLDQILKTVPDLLEIENPAARKNWIDDEALIVRRAEDVQ